MSADEIIKLVREDLPCIANYPYPELSMSVLDPEIASVPFGEYPKLYTIIFKKRYRKGFWSWQFEKIE